MLLVFSASKSFFAKPRNLFFVFVLLFSSACSSDDDSDKETETTSASGELTDTSAQGILAFIQAGSFENWPTKQESPITDGVSVHRKISQTYVNDTAALALEQGETSLPSGSILVKTLYGSDGSTVEGHALMVKTSDGSDAQNWIWYEGFTSNDYANPYYGAGLSLCANCHDDAGVDYVRVELESLGL